MRWVGRGAEPTGVEDCRRRYTQGWVEHYRNRMGERGPDLVNHWRDFRDELSDRFLGKCGYCERLCDGPASESTVDHFRPRSKFPELTYEWTNWVFCCARCNREKDNRWPDTGYIDPCAIPVDERPEVYLDVDDRTGEVIAKHGLTDAGRKKAQNTIEDIGLNSLDLRYFRIGWIRQFTAALSVLPDPEREAFVDYAGGPEREFAGITGMVAERLRQRGEL